MNDTLAEFRALMERAGAGCPDARRDLYEQYGDAVLRVVRRRLHRRMRSMFDSIDFTQSVWASFFMIPANGGTFATPDELINFLESVASNKVVEQFRRKMSGVRENLNRVKPLDEVSPPSGRDPTPSQLAVADEGWAALTAGQSPLVQQVLMLLREGYTYYEIAARTGLHPKAIQRRIQRLTKRVKL